MKKLEEIVTEEERQRIPIAQGLPWTTDEPEVRTAILEKANRFSGLPNLNVKHRNFWM